MPRKQARIAFTMTVAAAVAGLAPAPAAHADGAYQYGGSYVAAVPPFTWTGFHFGGYIGAAFSEGKLTDNLTGANMTGSNIPDYKIFQAKSLSGTVLPDGSVHD